MNQSDIHCFLTYCHELSEQKAYAGFLEQDTVWPEERGILYRNGILAGLYREQHPLLLKLLKGHCNRQELVLFLKRYQSEYPTSDFAVFAKKHGITVELPLVKEPLEEWILVNNYMLAYPLCEEAVTDREKYLRDNQELILNYVYLYLKYQYLEQDRCQIEQDQPNIEALYDSCFDKNTVYGKWHLIPVDAERDLSAYDDPVRIIDKMQNKTIFLDIPRPLAMVIDQLKKSHYISDAAFRGKNRFIYDGENHISSLCEAVERGRVFTLDIGKLPEFSKLFSDFCYEDSLWIIHQGHDLTFEELCSDIKNDGESIVTQMVHLQYEYDENRRVRITHLDHEYIFYDINSYENRLRSCRIKGEARKRIKTFKIDRSYIPVDYPCSMFEKREEELEEIEVPFIYFVLNTYFEHKELLREYFDNAI